MKITISNATFLNHATEDNCVGVSSSSGSGGGGGGGGRDSRGIGSNGERKRKHSNDNDNFTLISESKTTRGLMMDVEEERLLREYIRSKRKSKRKKKKYDAGKRNKDDHCYNEEKRDDDDDDDDDGDDGEMNEHIFCGVCNDPDPRNCNYKIDKNNISSLRHYFGNRVNFGFMCGYCHQRWHIYMERNLASSNNSSSLRSSSSSSSSSIDNSSTSFTSLLPNYSNTTTATTTTTTTSSSLKSKKKVNVRNVSSKRDNEKKKKKNKSTSSHNVKKKNGLGKRKKGTERGVDNEMVDIYSETTTEYVKSMLSSPNTNFVTATKIHFTSLTEELLDHYMWELGEPLVITGLLDEWNSNQKYQENLNFVMEKLLEKIEDTETPTVESCFINHNSSSNVASDRSGTRTSSKSCKNISSFFSPKYLAEECGKTEIIVRDNDTFVDLDNWNFSKYLQYLSLPSEHRNPARLYGKDVPCPIRWREYLFDMFRIQNHLPSPIPARLVYNGECDTLGDVNQKLRAISVMLYIGGSGTNTPTHRELCSSISQNMMVYAENKNTSTLWCMFKAKDKEQVATFYDSFYADVDEQNCFMPLSYLRDAPFKVYIIEQKLGDLVLSPPNAIYQEMNRCGTSIKISWNIMDPKCIPHSYDSLKEYRKLNKNPVYRIKVVTCFALRKRMEYYERFKSIIMQNNSIVQSFLLEYIPLFKTFLHVIDAEWIDHDGTNGLFPNPQKFNDDFKHMRTCSSCNADIFNRCYHCKLCESQQEDDEQDDSDYCLDCIREKRRTCHSKLVLTEYISITTLFTEMLLAYRLLSEIYEIYTSQIKDATPFIVNSIAEISSRISNWKDRVIVRETNVSQSIEPPINTFQDQTIPNNEESINSFLGDGSIKDVSSAIGNTIQSASIYHKIQQPSIHSPINLNLDHSDDGEEEEENDEEMKMNCIFPVENGGDGDDGKTKKHSEESKDDAIPKQEKVGFNHNTEKHLQIHESHADIPSSLSDIHHGYHNIRQEFSPAISTNPTQSPLQHFPTEKSRNSTPVSIRDETCNANSNPTSRVPQNPIKEFDATEMNPSFSVVLLVKVIDQASDKPLTNDFRLPIQVNDEESLKKFEVLENIMKIQIEQYFKKKKKKENFEIDEITILHELEMENGKIEKVAIMEFGYPQLPTLLRNYAKYTTYITGK